VKRAVVALAGKVGDSFAAGRRAGGGDWANFKGDLERLEDWIKLERAVCRGMIAAGLRRDLEPAEGTCVVERGACRGTEAACRALPPRWASPCTVSVD
jgi:hypothetical protein